MRYIIRNINNEVFLKLNTIPQNPYSGKYKWTCTHIQSNQILTLILDDDSPVPNNYQLFNVLSGDSQNFLLGQYNVDIYDITGGTKIKTELFTAQDSDVNDDIFFMANSNTASIYDTTSTSIPDIPTDFIVYLSEPTTISLRWKAGSSNTDAYNLWRKTGSGGTYIDLNTSIESLIYHDAYLTTGTTYFYKLRAFNEIGYSDFTDEVNVTTSDTESTGNTFTYLISSGNTRATFMGNIEGKDNWNIYSTPSTGETTYWGDIFGNILLQPDLQAQFDTKLDIIDFNTYSGNTLDIFTGYTANTHNEFTGYTASTHNEFTGYTASTHNEFTGYTANTHNEFTGYTANTHNEFTGYTASTNTRLIGIDNDIDYISGQTDLKLFTSDFNIYSGITDSRITSNDNDIIYLSGVTDTKLFIDDFNIYSGITHNIFTGYTANTDAHLDEIDNQIIYISGQTDTKLFIDDFNIYSGITHNIFTGYTASTDTRLIGIENDIDYISGVTDSNYNEFINYTGETDTRLIGIESDITTLSGRTDYNINYDTQANILAMNPSDHLNEKWWATDTMIEYDAKSVAITGNNHWIELGLQYDSDLDGYKLPTNLSGQTQDIGKEIIVDAYNNNTTGATTLNPSVFLSVGSHLTINKIGNYVMATAGDISTGSVYGINTTDAQPDDYFKLTTYGYVTGVNTSDYSVNTVLYVSPTVEGEITDIKPDINAFLIGIVTKQHETEGIIFVNTIRATSDVSSTITASQSTVWFTGDQTSGLTGGTFYIATPYGVGSVSGATITATVPDNSIVAGSQDLLGPSGTTELTYRSGLYEGQLDVSIESAANNERIYMEVYHANHDGTVIDSGISGTSVGDLGVRPVIYMESPLLSMAADIVTHVPLEGIILESYTQPQGDKFRMHILFEKVGAIGGDLNFTAYVGYDYHSWTKIPALIFLNDLVDVNTTGAVTGNVIKRNASGIWQASSVEINEVNGLQTDLDNKLDISGGTVYGDLSVTGNAYISGTTIVKETVYTNQDFIVMRSGATVPIGGGEISGIAINYADSSGDTVIFGSDNQGVMRIGWTGDTLQALATREDNPINQGLIYWDSGTTMILTSSGLTTNTINKLRTDIDIISGDTTSNYNNFTGYTAVTGQWIKNGAIISYNEDDVEIGNDLIVTGNISGTTINATGGNSTEWNTAYTHSQDNSQAHSDYLINNGSDSTTGTITAAGFSTSGIVTGINVTSGSNPGHTHTTTSISNLDTGDITTGTLSVSRGGTGLASITVNRLLTGNGTSAMTAEANLTFDGSELVVNGTISGTTICGANVTSGADPGHTHTAYLPVAGCAADSELLDGINSTGFLRSNVEDVKTVGNLRFCDNICATFGAGDDLDIYHNGTHSYIANSTGNLYIKTTGTENAIVAIPNSGVQLYFDDVVKLKTLSTGIEVTGTHYSSICSCSPIVCATTCLCAAGSTGYRIKVSAGCGCAIDWVATSDCRIKKCIEPISSALSKVDALCGVCYELCEDGTKDIGLIAQEVLCVEPRLVTSGEPDEMYVKKYGIKDEMLGLKYDKFAGLFVEAIKELKQQVIEQQEEINNLKTKINK